MFLSRQFLSWVILHWLRISLNHRIMEMMVDDGISLQWKYAFPWFNLLYLKDNHQYFISIPLGMRSSPFFKQPSMLSLENSDCNEVLPLLGIASMCPLDFPTLAPNSAQLAAKKTGNLQKLIFMPFSIHSPFLWELCPIFHQRKFLFPVLVF